MVERRLGLTLFCYTVLGLGAVFAIGPLYLAFCSASVSNQQLLAQGLALLPGDQLFRNLHAVTQRADIGRMLFNSFVVAVVVTAGKLLLSTITAYAVVYFRSPLRHLIFWTMFLTLMLPLDVRVIPTYAVISNLFSPLTTLLHLTGLDTLISAIAGIKISPTLNLVDSYAGLSLPFIASAVGTFLFRQFYQTVPAELSEAARVDGAGPIRFFIDILLPLSKTNLAALGTITFITTWKEYMWPLVATNSSEMRTIAVGVANFFPTEATQLPEWNLVMAAALAAFIPPVLVIALLQRWFVKSTLGVSK